MLLKYKSMKISELSSKFNVSEMTIHRDLKPLIEEGFVVKTFGGVTLANNVELPKENTCIYCHQNINDRLSFRLILNNDQIESTCCPHCGLLRYEQVQDNVVQVMCQDFLRSTTINARYAYFVMDTSLDLGCCKPQALPFELKEHAKNFTQGFGGKIYSFKEAMKIVYDKMASPKE